MLDTKAESMATPILCNCTILLVVISKVVQPILQRSLISEAQSVNKGLHVAT